jgi:exoribonuclease R
MDKRILVALDGWDADSMYPSGHYLRTLGEIGKVETETVSERAGGTEGVRAAVCVLGWVRGW